jgi:hypothetical protein
MRDKAMRRAFALAAVWLAATYASAQIVSDDEKKEGFKPLFNGKNFEGWDTNEKVLMNWSVDKGMMKMKGRGLSIFTKDQYEDFILRFEWRANKDNYNSGLFIRGFNQVQMMKRDAGQFFANKKEGKGVPELHKKPGEWNEWEIACIGTKVTLKVNGKLAWEVNDFNAKKGKIGIESEGSPIDFKNMRIKIIEAKK